MPKDCAGYHEHNLPEWYWIDSYLDPDLKTKLEWNKPHLKCSFHEAFVVFKKTKEQNYENYWKIRSST